MAPSARLAFLGAVVVSASAQQMFAGNVNGATGGACVEMAGHACAADACGAGTEHPDTSCGADADTCENACGGAWCPDPCDGGIVLEGSDSMQSLVVRPLLGRDYPDDMDGSAGARCSWELSCQDSTLVPELTFTAFSVELNYDYVYVFDGAVDTCSRCGTALAGESECADTLNGGTLSAIGESTRTATGPAMLIQLDSDGSVVGTFAADFRCVAPDPAASSFLPQAQGGCPCQADSDCTGAGDVCSYGYCQQPFHSHDPVGSTTLTLETGGDGKYFDDADLSFSLSCPSGTASLSFTAFATEARYDFVSVYDGADDTTPVLIDDADGDQLPADVTSTGSEMLVTFRSDGSVGGTGFTADFTCLDADCIGSWSACDMHCSKTYTVSAQAVGAGAACLVGDGATGTCQPGEDVCPNAAPQCTGCWTGTSGPCQRSDTTECAAYQSDTWCAAAGMSAPCCSIGYSECPPPPAPPPPAPLSGAGAAVGATCTQDAYEWKGESNLDSRDFRSSAASIENSHASLSSCDFNENWNNGYWKLNDCYSSRDRVSSAPLCRLICGEVSACIAFEVRNNGDRCYMIDELSSCSIDNDCSGSEECWEGSCAKGKHNRLIGLMAPDEDCAGSFSACTAACEAAGARVWSETAAQSGTGAACPRPSSCQPGEEACPVNTDCAGSFSACTAACEAAGARVWSETAAQSGTGAACPRPSSCRRGEDDCAAAVSNVDCSGQWSACTAACEIASARTWSESIASSGSGAACPQVSACQPGEEACPVNTDCAGSFSACTIACEAADARVWSETAAQSGTGAACPQASACQPGVDACPNNVDCVAGWSPCSTSCEKVYTVASTHSGQGTPCETTDETIAQCSPGEDNCPAQDCVGDWTTCTSDCFKTFSVHTVEAGGGAACEATDGAVDSCAAGTDGCVLTADCIGSWLPCDEQCSKVYSISTPVSGAGTPCDHDDGHSDGCAPGEDRCPLCFNKHCGQGSCVEDVQAGTTSCDCEPGYVKYTPAYVPDAVDAACDYPLLLSTCPEMFAFSSRPCEETDTCPDASPDEISRLCSEWMDVSACASAVDFIPDWAQGYSQACACHRVDCGHGTCAAALAPPPPPPPGCVDDDAAVQAAKGNEGGLTCAGIAAEGACDYAESLGLCGCSCVPGAPPPVTMAVCTCDANWGGPNCNTRLCQMQDFMELIAPPPTISRVAALKADSGEEKANGKMTDHGRSDLDLMRDGKNLQMVAIRFRAVDLDPTALAEAKILFDVKRVANGRRRRGAELPVTIEISAELSTAPAVITGADADISSRTKTTARVLWEPPPTFVEHEELVTPDLSSLVAEIAALSGWTTGGAITIIFTHVAGDGNRWLETESRNNGVETPSMFITTGSSPATSNIWANLRGPDMRSSCGTVLQMMGDGSNSDVAQAVWQNDYVCPCFTEVSTEEAHRYYHCTMSPTSNVEVFENWLSCQPNVDVEELQESCPFSDGTGSPCQDPACTAGPRAHATEVCCQSINSWCESSSDQACTRAPALCDQFLPTGTALAISELESVCDRELRGCLNNGACRGSLDTFLDPLESDSAAQIAFPIRQIQSRKLQRLALCAVQPANIAQLSFVAPISPCDLFPCEHQGACSEAGDSFTCACKPGWAGNVCEVDIDECASSPCENGGACEEEKIDGFKCLCAVGFRGKHCENSAQPAKTTMGGATGVTTADFMAALTSGGQVTADAIEITSATYTVAAEVSLPVPFPDESSAEGQAARLQFRQGLANALGLTSVDQIGIDGIGRRQLSEEEVSAEPVFVAPPGPAKKLKITDHKIKFLGSKLKARYEKRAQEVADSELAKAYEVAMEARRRRLQAGATVAYSVTAEGDMSASLQTSDFDHTMAAAINDAGDALAPVAGDDMSSTVSNVQTEITFEVISDPGGTNATGNATAPTVSDLSAAMGSLTGVSVEVEEMPIDMCMQGLAIANSDRHIANACSGSSGEVCDYACVAGYATPTTAAAHTCGGNGAFSGGECLPVGSVVCPDTWTALTAGDLVGTGFDICDSMNVDTDAGLPSTTIEEVVLAAQQKWSHCLLSTCTAPAGADANANAACDAVEITATTVASDCTAHGCEFTDSPLSIASVLCNGEACSAEFEMGLTTVELAAIDTSDMSEALCSFSVTVTDNEAPVIDEASCPTAMVQTKGNPSWPTIDSTDNSGDVEVVSTVRGSTEPLTVENAPTGTNAIVFTASDASGNKAACGATFGLW